MVSQNNNQQQQSSSGLFTPRLATDPAYRFSFELSPADLERFHALPPRSLKSIVVTDLNAGLQWRVRQAECGAGCFCDAEALPVENSRGFDALPRPRLTMEDTEYLIGTLMDLAVTSVDSPDSELVEHFEELVELVEGYDSQLIAHALIWAATEIKGKQ